MSEPRKGLGLFVNKRTSAAPTEGSPKQKDVRKRWLMLGAGAVAFVVLASTMFSGNRPAPRQPNPKDAPALSTTPKGAAEADWRAQSQQEITRARQTAEAAEAETRKLREDIAALRDLVCKQPRTEPVPPVGIVAPPVPGQAGAPGTFVQPAPPVPPVTIAPPPRLGSAPATEIPALETPSAAPMVFEAPRAANEANAAESVKAKVSYKKNPNSGLLPAGSFAPVAMLNGLDAGTSSATQSNPMPVLMNIGEHARLPGAARYQLRNCFVLGTGHGDLSAERVYVRISRLSCVDRSDRLVLSQEVSGYLVDSDGKLGMRGVVTNRQGSRLHKALLAGFAQGLSGALGQAQGTVSSSLLGTTNSVTGADALRASGLSGAQAATSQLAQWYLKEAQSIFPVITVDAGRTGTIVFTNSASLAWGSGDAQFQKDVRPE